MWTNTNARCELDTYDSQLLESLCSSRACVAFCVVIVDWADLTCERNETYTSAREHDEPDMYVS